MECTDRKIILRKLARNTSGFTFVEALIAFSIVGIFLAYKMYIKPPELPTKVTEKVPGLYDLIYNKYYVDELYDATVVEPIKNGSVVLWKEADAKVIDGVVNGTASLVERFSAIIRKLETGYVQNYALGILVGVAIITGYYLGR